MSTNYAIVLDSSTQRHKDENGFLHVNVSHISKETVNPYYGREIIGWENSGLDPEKIYYGYRSGEALEQGASTFNGLPILLDHHLESAEEPQKEHRVGSLGTDAEFVAPYLNNSLIITDAQAIEQIESGERVELSSAYKFEPIFSSGTFNGEPYDFIMTNIRGNHVALVHNGRAGPDVVVADSNIKEKRGLGMNIKKKLSQILTAWDANPEIEHTEVDLGKALLAVNEVEAEEEGLTKEQIGLDEDKDAKIKEIMQTYFANATPEEIKKISDALTDLAYSASEANTDDEDLNSEEGVNDGEGEEAKASDDLSKAMDACGLDAEDPAVQKAFAEGVKYGEHLEKNPEERKKLDSEHESEGMKTAMDAAIVVKTAEYRALNKMRSLQKAANEVRHLAYINDPLAFDSAEEIYKQALRLSKIADPAKHPRKAWRSLCITSNISQPTRMVADSQSKLTGCFSNLQNIRVEG